MNDKLSILVLSCDKYSDLWKPFFDCFFKFWSDCDYKIYLGANNKTFNDSRVETILSGDDKDWSSSFLNILDQVKSEYVIVLLEDLFLVDFVNNEKIDSVFEFLINKNFNFCHIGKTVGADKIINNDIGLLDGGMPYRVNVFGIWKKVYLKNILIKGENAWNFEIMGSYRASYDDGFYFTREKILNTLNMVEKGKWFPDKLENIKKMGINIQDSQRGVLGGLYLFKSKIQILIVSVVVLIPWRFRVKIMGILRKIFFSY